MTDDPLLAVLNRIASVSPQSKASKEAPSFAAEGQLALDALQVDVTGVGTLSAPLDCGQAQALHAVSTPAPHGQRQRTVLDTRVRHTGEVASDQVVLRWSPGELQSLQTQAATALGLPQLEARLHNLLVYGPGQFFKPHQDTEKHPGMVGTLVLVWPSPHIGGELQVQQADIQRPFASQQLQAQALRWFAFYADCRHEVKPVVEGWRVVLTFDLVLPAGAAVAPAAAHPALVKALQDRFLPGGVPRREPWLLLLDHEYTEHGLRWPLLKGDDRVHVAALCAAAQALDLVPQLALAEIHESWTASVPYNGRGRGRGGDPEPDELIEESLSLDFWVDVDGKSHKGQALTVALADCASFTAGHDGFLVNEEYEGYMGNYGETLDYWYRRAALVLQSPAAAEASRFATLPEAALADALKLARRADQRPALAQRLQMALPDLVRHAQSKGLAVFARYAQLAAAMPADLAAALCTPFEWRHLVPAHARPLAELATAHGPDWLRALLRSWAQAAARRTSWGWSVDEGHVDGSQGSAATGPWPQPLPGFIDAAVAAAWPAGAVQEVVSQALGLQHAADRATATPAQHLAAWPGRLRAVCELAQALQRLQDPTAMTPLLQSLLQQVAVLTQAYPALGLVPLLQALNSPAAVAAPERMALLARVRSELQAALQSPMPAADDQGLRGLRWTCRCADCQPAIAWAESPAGQPLVLAIAEARRQHVQSALQDAAARLSFATLRQGSPHKLVLTKRPDQHAERLRQRSQWAADLAALAH